MNNTKIKILFSEDDEFLVDIYKNKFEKAGFDVRSVQNLNSIISEVKDFKPDFIFFDLLYDGVPAFDVLKQIKNDNETKNIPVVALTNLRKEEDRKKAMEAGALDYVSKLETSLEKMIVIVEEKLYLKICPNCHERAKIVEGKCNLCGTKIE